MFSIMAPINDVLTQLEGAAALFPLCSMLSVFADATVTNYKAFLGSIFCFACLLLFMLLFCSIYALDLV